MTVATAAGAKFYIASSGGSPDPGTPANQTEYEALTYTEVGELEDLGDFGDEAGQATFTALGDRRVRKFKTSFDGGEIAVVCGSDPADTGQAYMSEALAEDFNYPFKIELDDEITVGGTPTTLYCYGIVMSERRNVGTVENIVRQNFTVGVNSPFTVVAAT
jgi:hypothetical protein